VPYEPKWPEFDQAVSLIASRTNRESDRAAVAEELVAAIRGFDVNVRWPDISADASIPTDWRWFGPILGTGAFRDVLVCRADIDRSWPLDGTTANVCGKDRPGRGPASMAAKIQGAAKELIETGIIPGRTMTWEKFREAICTALNVKPETRGFSLDSIQNAARPVLKDL
jgi:hypothetical protein